MRPEYAVISAILASAGGAVAAVAIQLLRTRGHAGPRTRLALVACAVVCVAAAGWLVLSTRSGGALQTNNISFNEYLAALRPAAPLGIAVVAGLVLPGALIAAVSRLPQPRGYSAAAGALGVIAAAGLWSTEAMTSSYDVGNDPQPLTGEGYAVRHIADLPAAVGLAYSPGAERGWYASLLSSGGEIDWVSARGDVSVAGTVPAEDGRMMFEIALDSAHGVLYVSTQEGPPTDRGISLYALPVVAPGRLGEAVRIDGPYASQPPGGDHFGGSLAICDGYLYMGVGDADAPSTRDPAVDRAKFAQYPDRAEGKVLRYRLTEGAAEPAGLLWDDPPVFALGFRNPFGMTCADGLPLVADNGPVGHDQVRVVSAASNHEWPLSDGRERLRPPLWDSGKLAVAPTGIVTRGNGGRSAVFATFITRALYELDLEAPGALQLIARLPTGALAVEADERGCLVASDFTALWAVQEPGCE